MKQNDLHKQLAAFEEFKTEILPALQRDVASGMNPKQLREKYAALAQARLITDALTQEDAGKAAVAAKDILDRSEGKAKEKIEHTHKYKDMKDEELDAILKSELDDLADMENRFEQ